jgi:hypothetical protein
MLYQLSYVREAPILAGLSSGKPQRLLAVLTPTAPSESIRLILAQTRLWRGENAMNMKLALGTFLVAVVVSVVLAATGGAAKPEDSMTCSISGGITFTWAPGTTSIHWEWEGASGQTAVGDIIPPHNGPGSATVATPPGASLSATFFKKRPPSAKLAPIDCT